MSLFDMFGMVPPLPAGWRRVRGSTRRHYFAKGADHSLCRVWEAERIDDDAYDRRHAHSRNCSECARKIPEQMRKEREGA
jgi:hypothetical protein